MTAAPFPEGPFPSAKPQTQRQMGAGTQEGLSLSLRSGLEFRYVTAVWDRDPNNSDRVPALNELMVGRVVVMGGEAHKWNAFQWSTC